MGFEPAIPASEQPQTHALDHAATGISPPSMYLIIIVKIRHYFLMFTFLKNYSISYHTSKIFHLLEVYFSSTQFHFHSKFDTDITM
jgi:hypothetical protein